MWNEQPESATMFLEVRTYAARASGFSRRPAVDAAGLLCVRLTERGSQNIGGIMEHQARWSESANYAVPLIAALGVKNLPPGVPHPERQPQVSPASNEIASRALVQLRHPESEPVSERHFAVFQPAEMAGTHLETLGCFTLSEAHRLSANGKGTQARFLFRWHGSE